MPFKICPGSNTRSRHALCAGFFHMTMKRIGTGPPGSHVHTTQPHSHMNPALPVNNASLCSQTQSVNVGGPSSLPANVARCQTAFLRQLPFLTSATLTWFHLSALRNLFSFSVMKYYTGGTRTNSPPCRVCRLWLLFPSAVGPLLLRLLLLHRVEILRNTLISNRTYMKRTNLCYCIINGNNEFHSLQI